MRGLRHAITAFFGVGLAESLSYPLVMLDRLVNLVAIVVIIYLGGRLVGDEGVTVPLPAGYFLYGMVGLAVMQVFSACLASFRFRIRQFQLHGVLEACVMTRTRLWQILLAVPAYELTTATLQALILVTVAHVVSGQPVDPVSALAALGVLALGCSSFLCLGLISASAVLVLKRGEPITRVVTLATFLFSGAFFPRELLPPWLAGAAGLLPVAPTVDAIRALLYDETSGFELQGALLRLAATTLVLLPIVAWTYRLAVRRVLRDGSLSHY